LDPDPTGSETLETLVYTISILRKREAFYYIKKNKKREDSAYQNQNSHRTIGKPVISVQFIFAPERLSLQLKSYSDQPVSVVYHHTLP
jgi:hypothetical protein